MAFFRKLLGGDKPRFEDPAAFRQFVAERLRRQDEIDRVEADEEDDMLLHLFFAQELPDQDEKTFRSYLTNIYRTYNSTDLSTEEAEEQLRIFIASIIESAIEPQLQLDQLLPAVRHIDYMGPDDAASYRAAQEAGERDPLAKLNVVASPFYGDLVILMLQDLPNSFLTVTRSHLKEADIEIDAAWRQAEANLLKLANDVRTEEAGDLFNAAYIESAPYLGASLLLIPQLFIDYMQQKGYEELFVAVPVRELVYMARPDAEGLDNLVNLAMHKLRESDHIQSSYIYKVGLDGVFHPHVYLDEQQGTASMLS